MSKLKDTTQGNDEPRYEIVIASHNENLNWLKYLPKERQYIVTVSSSSGRTHAEGADRVIQRENYGREAGHYLHHIITQYDNLTPVTVFIQGDPWPHAAMYGNPCIMLELLFGNPAFRHPLSYLGKEYSIHDTKPHKDSEHYKLFKKLWGDQPLPPAIPISIGAHFYARKEIIHAMPKSHYEKLLAEAKDPVVYKDDPYYTLAHTLEGSWGHVFNHASMSSAL